MIDVVKYNKYNEEEWNNLVSNSSVDTFLFYRDFIDYHSDRFTDSSFLFYKKGKVEAVLPGNIDGKTFYSHQGLTYGGIIPSKKMTSADILESFELLNTALKTAGIDNVIYKALPLIYQLSPVQEDLYALFRLGAVKIACNLSSTIFQNSKIPFNESRKSGLRKATKFGLTVSETDNFESFYKILENNLLTNHGTKPVHSLEELILLKSRFPNNIRLFCTSMNENIVGGCVVFEMKKVVHIQYISANDAGKEFGALDLLFDILINHRYAHIPVFDFGQSTENMGYYLNKSLIFQKEGFGGRGVVYDIYEYKL
ncbi:MAG: GNAT family N-acetyltransferase [Bacteroidales bacterium]